ncbi:MAG: hypothetical protein KGJ80_12250, partial [Chloroflexota bacterium]|nr:hypothetical protein [Chloroflexota bacterium]
MKTKKKPNGYWDDFANVERELRAFIVEHGAGGIMPNQGMLVNADRRDLIHAIRHNGGFSDVAERLGLELRRTRKFKGYWGDFANFEKELRAFITSHGTDGIMPSIPELQSAGRRDVARAVGQHGGFPAVAERLGLKRLDNRRPMQKRMDPRKPSGYWDDFANVEKELRAFVTQHGIEGVMPTQSQLHTAERNDLNSAIGKHGGFWAVAKRLGLMRSDADKLAGYWNDFANVDTELHAFISKHGTSGVMPSYPQLKLRGYGSLANAIDKHGGSLVVAERLGLDRSDADKPKGYWDNFANVERELRAFVAAHNKDGTMPTSKELTDAGYRSLVHAINKHGGFWIVSDKLGLKPTNRPAGYWDDFANLERELRTFISDHGMKGSMPTAAELNTAGRSDLTSAMGKYGGHSVVARRLGLTYTSPERVTQQTASSVELTARAIQPLAESNLLSGAQVMVILRRAGLLEYHNPRILRLNAGLARGKHDEIESAIANLVGGGEEIAVEQVTIAESDILSAEEAEALASVGLDAHEGKGVQLNILTVPATQREQAVIRGLSALGELRLPLDNVLQLLTSRILWQSFYKRLYSWYGSLNAVQTVTADDVQAAILSAYPEHAANEFIAEASALFTYEVEQAINFAASLADFGWCGPRLRLHQADAARRMAEVLGRLEVAATTAPNLPSQTDSADEGRLR